MKTLLVVFFSLILFSCSDNPNIIDEFPDQGTHFNYNTHGNISSATLKSISEKLESNYSRIVSDLNADIPGKITIGIWETEKQFMDDMQKDLGIKFQGATGYLAGIRDVRVLNTSDPAQIALHEFAHSVSLHVNNTISNNPRWLWEAVAIYEAGEFIHPNHLSYMREGNFPSISELNTAYNQSSHKIYSVGYILCEFIVENWGMDYVIKLINSNGNVQKDLGISLSEFEIGWHNFISDKYFGNK